MLSRILRLLPAVLSALVCALCIGVMHHATLHAHQLVWSPYGYAELLENYSGGFTRRALLGDILAHAAHGSSALTVVNRFVFAEYSLYVLCLCLLGWAGTRLRGATSLLLLLIPGGALQMIVTYEYFYRKEMLFYAGLAFFGLLTALVGKVKVASIRSGCASLVVAGIVLFGLVATFVSESFLFLAAPAFSVLLLGLFRFIGERDRPDAASQRPGRIAAVSFLAMTAIMFVLCAVLFHGGQHTSDVIWASLHPTDRAYIAPAGRGAIGMMALGPGQLWHQPIAQFTNGLAWWYITPLVLLFLYCVGTVAFYDSGADRETAWRWCQVYLFIAGCTSVIFLFGYDWGRWVNAISLTFLVPWLALRDTVDPKDLVMVQLDHLPGLLGRALFRLRSFIAWWTAKIQRHRAAAFAGLIVFA